MLWIIYGDDFTKKNKEIQKIKDKSKPDIVVRYDEWSEEVLSLAESVDLFQETRLVIVSFVELSSIKTNLDQYKNSKSFFIFCFSDLKAPEKKALGDVECIDASAPAKKLERFNTFAITDAFLSKNKKDMWVLYRKALDEGVSVQEIHGLLLWQIRALFLVLHSTKKESGLNPFVFEKTAKALKNFTRDQLVSYESQLVSMYHKDMSSGGAPIETSFECFILEL